MLHLYYSTTLCFTLNKKAANSISQIFWYDSIQLHVFHGHGGVYVLTYRAASIKGLFLSLILLCKLMRNSNSHSNSSITDADRKASMSDLCHSYRDHDRGEARSKQLAQRCTLRTWKYSQPRTMDKVVPS